MSERRFWITTLSIIAAAIVLIVLVVNGVSKHVEHSKCNQFPEFTGRPTKFVEYNYFNFSCMTQTQDGKWIDIEKLREI